MRWRTRRRRTSAPRRRNSAARPSRAGPGVPVAKMRLMPLIPAKEVRPPLSRGPFLVVGLARSGQAAAPLRAARGERVRAVDSGHPEGAERLSRYGVEVVLDTDGLAQLEGANTVVQSPGVSLRAA